MSEAEQRKLGPIVCATRGGEGSWAVQLLAIQRATESKRPLIFLFVADPTNLQPYDAILKTAVESELIWMGETLLRIAQLRADSAHIISEVKIRPGRVVEEVIRCVRDQQASLLLLGAPRGTTANVFGDDAIEQFAQKIEQETGVSVEIARPETVELN